MMPSFTVDAFDWDCSSHSGQTYQKSVRDSFVDSIIACYIKKPINFAVLQTVTEYFTCLTLGFIFSKVPSKC